MRVSIIVLGALSTLSLAFPLKVCVSGLGLGNCENGHAKVHAHHHVTSSTGSGSGSESTGAKKEHHDGAKKECDGLLSCDSVIGKSGTN